MMISQTLKILFLLVPKTNLRSDIYNKNALHVGRIIMQPLIVD